MSPFPQLRADGKVLETSPARMGRLTAHDARNDFASLAGSFRENGYLWLKGLLDRETVLKFRGRALAHLDGAGLLAPGSDPEQGIAATHAPDNAAAARLLMELVRSTAFEAFCMQAELRDFMDRYLGGLSYLHKRKILRHTLPAGAASTPAHYDLIYLRGGTDRLVTAWLPIGDIPAKMGGLIYLEGSHALGVKMEREFAAKNANLPPEERISAYNANMTAGGWVSKDLPDMAERFDTRWLIADYEAGDVVLHTPYMIHAATLNDDPEGRVRLSTDIRFQNVRDEIDARWGNHWSLDDML